MNKKLEIIAWTTTGAAFNHVVELIGAECNSIVRLGRVKNVLSTLRLQYKLDEFQYESTSLAKFYKKITKLSPRGLLSHRGVAYEF